MKLSMLHKPSLTFVILNLIHFYKKHLEKYVWFIATDSWYTSMDIQYSTLRALSHHRQSIPLSGDAYSLLKAISRSAFQNP